MSLIDYYQISFLIFILSYARLIFQAIAACSASIYISRTGTLLQIPTSSTRSEERTPHHANDIFKIGRNPADESEASVHML